MTQGNFPACPFPPDLFSLPANHLLDCLHKNLNIQLVAAPGAGKSLLLRTLPHLAPPHLACVYLDLNLALACAPSPGSLAAFITPRLAQSPMTKQILLLDSFDQLATHPEKYSAELSWLAGIYHQLRGQLGFVFATHHPLLDPHALTSLGELGQLVSQKVYCLPFPNSTAAHSFARQCAAELQLQLNRRAISNLIHQSDCHLRTLKVLLETQTDPNSPRRQLHFQLLKTYTDRYHSQPHLLRLLGLKDAHGQWTIPAFADYLASSPPDSASFTDTLTPTEAKAYHQLKARANHLVNRDDLITLIWGDHAAPDISNHALDQLIHRLKSKLKASGLPEHIHTIRGRGHKLTPKAP